MSNQPLFASLFTGFGGFDIGAQAAGFDLAWGLENDAPIAEVARHNLGDHIRVADILDCEPHDFERVDAMHASPPCPNFSVAKRGGRESAKDFALAAKVAEFFTVLHPRIFTLENVRAYRHSKSWALIEDALHAAGYWVHVANVNSADYGVPQARRRMIVRAVLGNFVPYLPEPIEHVGWYSAVEDIVDDFPETNLAPWQLRSMPENVDTDQLVVGRGMIKERIAWQPGEPSPTVTTGVLSKSPLRAVLLGKNRGGDRTVINHVCGQKPAFTLTTQNAKQLKALNDARVVSFTPRGVARLMSFPDWYALPDTKTLVGRGLGNAVPPPVSEALLQDIKIVIT